MAPTVYSRDHYVRRHLTVKELAHACDIPADAIKSLTLDSLRQVSIPGKVISQVLASIQHGNRGGDFATVSTPILQDSQSQDGESDGDSQTTVRTSNIGVRNENNFEVSSSNPRSDKKLDERHKSDSETAKDDEGDGSINHFVVDPLPRAYNRASGYEIVCGNQKKLISAKATKSDDADVPEELWDKAAVDKVPWLKSILEQKGSAVIGHRIKRVFRNMRKWLLEKWKRKVVMELDRWMEYYGGHLPDLAKAEKVADQIRKHVQAASWWNWDGGSTLFFWRWPVQYMSDALYGMAPMYDGKKPSYWVAQPPYKDPVNKERVKAKVEKVMRRGYLKSTRPGDEVKSLMYMFDVPKGEDDIRMVYDGSKSGLNDALWAPWFPLPTAQSFFDVMLPGYWCSDNDMGDFFLNFPMHEELQKYCGVDVTGLFPLTDDERRELHIAIWTRAAMGIKNSPHIATLLAGRSNRLILGIPTDPDNPFAWEFVVLNLPGTKSYDCTMPWVFKCRTDGNLAADSKRFVDDLRNSAHSQLLAWEASTKIGKTTSWLGQQDAPRKRRPPSQTPGAWAATVVGTNSEGQLYKCVTEEAWDKAKKRIKYLAYYAGCDVSRDDVDFGIEKELNIQPKGIGVLIHKAAEKYRGYLIHISATYEAIVPYLKGLHLTLDGWREGRDDEGWKDPGWSKFHRNDHELSSYLDKAPTHVDCVRRFKDDMDVLLRLFSGNTPEQVPLRPTCHGTLYMIGDASGSGFGNTAWAPEDEEVDALFGGWDEETAKESSNYREALTAVNGLEDQLKKGKIQRGCEVFIVTDNWVTERVFENGTAHSKKLHDLVVRLRKLQMRGDIFIRVIWMAGTRMILQGTDSLSRGDLCSGVMAGDPFLDHVPLSQSAMDLQPNLLQWLMKHLPGNWKLLEPKGWFIDAFEDPEGRFIWAPPPAVARQAIDCLCDAHHIHPFTSHIVVVPSLMTGYWRKRLLKCSDVVWVIKSKCDIWPSHLHEPLTIAFIAPQFRAKPWRIGRTTWLAERRTHMRQMLAEDSKTAGRCLRQFWNKAIGLSGAMPRCLAPEVLRERPGRWIPCAGGPRFGGFDSR